MSDYKQHLKQGTILDTCGLLSLHGKKVTIRPLDDGISAIIENSVHFDQNDEPDVIGYYGHGIYMHDVKLKEEKSTSDLKTAPVTKKAAKKK